MPRRACSRPWRRERIGGSASGTMGSRAPTRSRSLGFCRRRCEREAPDLVLCGVQSSDAVNSATGIAVAGHLGLPHVAVVKRIELAGATATSSASSRAASSRCCGSSCRHCLTIQTGINEPRYATLRAIKQAREKPLRPGDARRRRDRPGADRRGVGRTAPGARAAGQGGAAPRCSTAHRPRLLNGSPRSSAIERPDERHPRHRRGASRRAPRDLARVDRGCPAAEGSGRRAACRRDARWRARRPCGGARLRGRRRGPHGERRRPSTSSRTSRSVRWQR